MDANITILDSLFGDNGRLTILACASCGESHFYDRGHTEKEARRCVDRIKEGFLSSGDVLGAVYYVKRFCQYCGSYIMVRVDEKQGRNLMDEGIARKKSYDEFKKRQAEFEARIQETAKRVRIEDGDENLVNL